MYAEELNSIGLSFCEIEHILEVSINTTNGTYAYRIILFLHKMCNPVINYAPSNFPQKFKENSNRF